MKCASQCCALSEGLVDWRYCVGRPCCCLSCLSKSWEDHFIIVCLPRLTLLSRREPLGKWGLAAVFAVCSVFYLVASLALSGLLFLPVKLLGKVCYTAPKTSRLASCGIIQYDGLSRPQWHLNKAALWGLAAFTRRHRDQRCDHRSFIAQRLAVLLDFAHILQRQKLYILSGWFDNNFQIFVKQMF